jgi:hypothetical protein
MIVCVRGLGPFLYVLIIVLISYCHVQVDISNTNIRVQVDTSNPNIRLLVICWLFLRILSDLLRTNLKQVKYCPMLIRIGADTDFFRGDSEYGTPVAILEMLHTSMFA